LHTIVRIVNRWNPISRPRGIHLTGVLYGA